MVLGISSAFSFEKPVTTNVYAWIKRSGGNFAQELIVAPTTTCTATGSTNCQVEVILDITGNPSKFVTAYSDAAATVPFKSSSAVLVTTYNPGGTAIIDARN